MLLHNYNAAVALEYAKRYALFPNPAYYYYDSLGGDCTNFCSQCLFQGCPQMNYMKTFGWYYKNANDKAPAWTAVESFYKFITSNKSYGPFGRGIDLAQVQTGDYIQLNFEGEKFSHTVIVSKVESPVSLDSILICCHSYNRLDAQLSSLPPIKNLRVIRIDGYRK